MGAGGGKRRGRPRDLTCGADPRDLIRHPVLLAEPDDGRAEAVQALAARATYARTSERVQHVAAFDDALRCNRPIPCVMVDAELARSSKALVAVRSERPALPIVVTDRRAASSAMTWCMAHRLAYLPGTLEEADVEAVMDDAEGFESAPLPHRPWLVRRGLEQARRHEVTYVVRLFHGEAAGSGLTRSSEYSVRSRARRHLRASSLEQLRRDRLAQWRRFGVGEPPWRLA